MTGVQTCALPISGFAQADGEANLAGETGWGDDGQAVVRGDGRGGRGHRAFGLVVGAEIAAAGVVGDLVEQQRCGDWPPPSPGRCTGGGPRGEAQALCRNWALRRGNVATEREAEQHGATRKQHLFPNCYLQDSRGETQARQFFP